MTAPEAAPPKDVKHEWDRFERPRKCKTCGFEEHDGSGMGYKPCPPKSAPMREDVTPGQRFRHFKRGTEYEVIGIAELQASQPQQEHARLAIYRGDDGKLWARNTGEFSDGRFELLAHTARPDAGDAWAAISRLRDEEADSVTVLCDNPDGPPNNAVKCCGFWTGFAERRFEGETILEALSRAVAAKDEASKVGYPPLPRPDAGDEVERVGLALLNSDRVRNDWPSVDSLSYLNDEDADAYRDSARAALAAIREGVDRGMVDEMRSALQKIAAFKPKPLIGTEREKSATLGWNRAGEYAQKLANDALPLPTPPEVTP